MFLLEAEEERVESGGDTAEPVGVLGGVPGGAVEGGAVESGREVVGVALGEEVMGVAVDERVDDVLDVVPP